MPEDQTAPDEVQDTQVESQETDETAVADTSDESPVVDYKSRYENLLPEFTRKSQRLAELEQNLSSDDDDEYEYEYEEEDDSFDPYDDRLSRIENLLAQQHQQATLAQQQQAEVSFINREITALEQERSEEFSEEEFDLLGHLSERVRDEHGQPDVRRAYEQFNRILDNRKSKWVSGKKSPQVAAGPGAAQVPDLDDREKRAEYIDRMLSGDE